VIPRAHVRVIRSTRPSSTDSNRLLEKKSVVLPVNPPPCGLADRHRTVSTREQVFLTWIRKAMCLSWYHADALSGLYTLSQVAPGPYGGEILLLQSRRGAIFPLYQSTTQSGDSVRCNGDYDACMKERVTGVTGCLAGQGLGSADAGSGVTSLLILHLHCIRLLSLER
jgi:hypothetical protein